VSLVVVEGVEGSSGSFDEATGAGYYCYVPTDSD